MLSSIYFYPAFLQPVKELLQQLIDYFLIVGQILACFMASDCFKLKNIAKRDVIYFATYFTAVFVLSFTRGDAD